MIGRAAVLPPLYPARNISDCRAKGGQTGRATLSGTKAMPGESTSPAPPRDTGASLHLAFLILPGFPMACLTSLIEPLRAANEISGRAVFAWSLVSEDGAAVESSAAVSFHPAYALAQLRAPGHLIVLAPPIGRFANPRHAEGALRALARHGTVMGAISGGVFTLARAGVLAGHVASVHWVYAAAFADEFPDIATVDDVIKRDGARITISGAAAAFDFALMLIEERLGPEVMAETACWFQHPLVRGYGVRQKIPARLAAATADMLPEPLASAVRIMSEHLQDPIQIADICAQIDISPRHLERLFKKLAGTTPLGYYRNLRLGAARQLVLYSNRPIKEIAQETGYVSASLFRQRYRALHGLAPEADRAKINTFRVQGKRPMPTV